LLGVLASAADDKPLVILVDYFQWIDPESQRILLFVAQRLPGREVTLRPFRQRPVLSGRSVALLLESEGSAVVIFTDPA
jgi:predicted ATPase